MFEAVKGGRRLDVQLVYFRGFANTVRPGGCLTLRPWRGLMTTVSCQGGQQTQWQGVTRSEGASRKVGAMVYVGDCVEENVDLLAQKAGELKLVGMPVFPVQEAAMPMLSRLP
ncbi:MAG: hypothetical protein H6876_02560 [Hyphomicrobiaceae bacterium]|nr:hypothetical protein [Hyphomicrobiaceae bacterium]